MRPPVKLTTWSKIESASRIPPSALRAITFKASDSAEIFSFEATYARMLHGIFYADAIKVVYLTARQDGRKNLMFLGCSENKNSMPGRLFKRFKESIEGRGRKHSEPHRWCTPYTYQFVEEYVPALPIGGYHRPSYWKQHPAHECCTNAVRWMPHTTRRHYKRSPSSVGVIQLIVLAKIRAQVVFPTPRGPQKR